MKLLKSKATGTVVKYCYDYQRKLSSVSHFTLITIYYLKGNIEAVYSAVLLGELNEQPR